MLKMIETQNDIIIFAKYVPSSVSDSKMDKTAPSSPISGSLVNHGRMTVSFCSTECSVELSEAGMVTGVLAAQTTVHDDSKMKRSKDNITLENNQY
jgi:hypothetical protein